MRIPIYLVLLNFFKIYLCDEKGAGFSDASVNCGGDFSGLQYPVVSPNYPNDYPDGQDCVYILRGSQSAQCDQDFHLQFLDFQLEASKGCEKDYVKVGAGSIYCGNSIGIRKFTGQERSLKLVFHSDGNTTARGFRILVTPLPCAADPLSDRSQNQTVYVPVLRADFPEDTSAGMKENLRNSYPVFRPEVQFGAGADSSPKNPSGNLQLPGYEGHRFHDENHGHVNSANGGGIGSITSYLYLPPGPNSGPNISSVMGRFGDESRVAEPSANLILPSRENAAPFVAQLFHKTRKTFVNPFQNPQSSPELYQSGNRWATYGVPNPTIFGPGFDPLANDYSGAGYRPVSPNCGPGINSNRDPTENFSPVPSYGNADTGGGEYDLSFGVGGVKEPGYFGPGGGRYPNNNFYSPVDGTTYYGSGLSECCGSAYSSNSFLLTSPGFPALIYSSRNYECQYTIRRSSESVCQLQMYLKFFNFGSDDQFCAYGYVEIDGARICGCRTGVNVTSSFDNIATKTITVKYIGYPRNKFSGFVIEVTQVGCSTSYPRVVNEPRLHQSPILIRDFKRKRDAADFPLQGADSAALKTGDNLQLLNSCRIFKFLNWVKAAKQVYLRSAQCSGTVSVSATGNLASPVSVIPIFPEAGNSLINRPVSSDCQGVNLIDGTVTSGYYPSGYSNNLNQCYRFYRAPGYCQLELAILDFDLENSTLCAKDYVAFSGQKRRYCGTSLSGTRTIFDLTQAAFADLYFVTDSSGSGRGFRAGFTQISC